MYLTKTWFTYSRFGSLVVVVARWQSLWLVGSCCGSLTVVECRYEFELTFSDHLETNFQFCKYSERPSTTIDNPQPSLSTTGQLKKNCFLFQRPSTTLNDPQ